MQHYSSCSFNSFFVYRRRRSTFELTLLQPFLLGRDPLALARIHHDNQIKYKRIRSEIATKQPTLKNRWENTESTDRGERYCAPVVPLQLTTESLDEWRKQSIRQRCQKIRTEAVPIPIGDSNTEFVQRSPVHLWSRLERQGKMTSRAEQIEINGGCCPSFSAWLNVDVLQSTAWFKCK